MTEFSPERQICPQTGSDHFSETDFWQGNKGILRVFFMIFGVLVCIEPDGFPQGLSFPIRDRK